jgi:hypothetical protein
LGKLTDEEIEGIRYLRKTAIRALANRRMASLQRQGGKAGRDRFAEVLMGIAAGNKEIVPALSWHERTEAAVALLMFRPSTEYRAEVALAGVGEFIHSLAREASADKSGRNDYWHYFAYLLLVRFAEIELEKNVQFNTVPFYTTLQKTGTPVLQLLFDVREGATKIVGAMEILDKEVRAKIKDRKVFSD